MLSASSLIVLSMFSFLSLSPEILLSISYSLLVMLVYVTPDFFFRFSISRVVSFCVFFIVSISVFNSIICLVVFSSSSGVISPGSPVTV